MTEHIRRLIPPAAWALLVSLSLVLSISADSIQQAYLPMVVGGKQPAQEVRALWITRFDWTSASGADPEKIDEIVANAAMAGFNTLYFQVRAEADAYYRSNVEPWSRRLSGTLGQDPGWDPLQSLIEKAHASGIEVHAYINVYPLWTGCQPPPEDTTPRHLYYDLQDAHGTTDDQLNGVQWDDSGTAICQPGYYYVSPASIPFDNHLLSVVRDLSQNYDIDGVHLDHIRYAGRKTSCDPVTESRFGDTCFATEAFGDWQRRQVNSTVEKLSHEVKAVNSELLLTAAVWPVYRDAFGWGASSGYDDYYQDPKAWLVGDYVDGVSPMLYTGAPVCDADYFWTRERWATIVADYQDDRNGHMIIPGIGVNFCTTDDFAEIAARIELARAAGTAGHAIFSYGGLLAKAYFDDLAEGPYATAARPPSVNRH